MIWVLALQNPARTPSVQVIFSLSYGLGTEIRIPQFQTHACKFSINVWDDLFFFKTFIVLVSQNIVMQRLKLRDVFTTLRQEILTQILIKESFWDGLELEL